MIVFCVFVPPESKSVTWTGKAFDVGFIRAAYVTKVVPSPPALIMTGTVRESDAKLTPSSGLAWEKAGVASKVDLRLAPAVETLDKLVAAGESGRYDFAFIDADKGNYLGYYERCLKLVRAGGLIAIDNTLWNGWVADPSHTEDDTRAIRAFKDKVAADERVDASLVPIGDGLTLARKR